MTPYLRFSLLVAMAGAACWAAPETIMPGQNCLGSLRGDVRARVYLHGTIIPGKNSGVIRVRVEVGRRTQEIDVRLPGITPIEPDFDSYIAHVGIGKKVGVGVGLLELASRRLPRELIAMISFGEAEDLGLSLIRQKMAQPGGPPISVFSDDLGCRYNMAARRVATERSQ